MKKKELRIGNIVDRGTVYEIRNTVARIHYGDRYSLIPYEELKPIQLTEETLLKCSGVKKFEDYYIVNTVFKILLNESGTAEYAQFGNLITPCVSLHELQNLYKILTKQELEINL